MGMETGPLAVWLWNALTASHLNRRPHGRQKPSSQSREKSIPPVSPLLSSHSLFLVLRGPTKPAAVKCSRRWREAGSAR